MKKWEYRVIELSDLENPDIWELELDSQGEEGWEILRLLDRNNKLYAFFKRPVQ